MKISEVIVEIKKGEKDSNGFTKCWPGKHAEGTKKGKNGKPVRNCVPNESVEESEERTMSRAAKGHEKYGKKGMQALAKAGQDGASEEKMDSIRKKYDRYDEAANPAQQAAIAINMKKHHKKPKHKNESIDPELAEEFALIESIVHEIADKNGVDAEFLWEDLDHLTDDELYAFAVTSDLTEDWQKANKHDNTDGMSQKAVNAYRREHPGSKLKTAVTTKPSKLKRGSKASKRRSSYCSRSRGQMKMHSINCSKTPDKAICKARRRWNC